MSFTACLTDLDVGVVAVANFSDGSSASHADLSNFAGRKSYLCVISFLCHELCAVSCGSCKLTALARLKFNIVDNCTNRNVCDRKCVSCNDVGFRAGYNLLSNGKSLWSEDVFLFAVCINKECDVCASVRIVFDGSYRCRNIVLCSLEVDDSVFWSCAAALMSNSDFASVVSSCVLFERYSQGLFRR